MKDIEKVAGVMVQTSQTLSSDVSTLAVFTFLLSVCGFAGALYWVAKQQRKYEEKTETRLQNLETTVTTLSKTNQALVYGVVERLDKLEQNSDYIVDKLEKKKRG